MPNKDKQRKQVAVADLAKAIFSGDSGVETEAQAFEHAELIWDQSYFRNGSAVAEGDCMVAACRYRDM